MRRALHRLGPWRVRATRARAAVAAAGHALADRAAALAYRRAEVGVLALLAASLIGGLGVDRWRARQPVLLDWLEAEPPRLGARPPAGARVPGQVAARERRGGPSSPVVTVPRGPARLPREPPAGPPGAPALDLNRATARDLARLPGIGPRLAARIVEARAARGGWFESPADLAAIPGLGRGRAAAVAALVTTDAPQSRRAPPAAPREPP